MSHLFSIHRNLCPSAAIIHVDDGVLAKRYNVDPSSKFVYNIERSPSVTTHHRNKESRKMFHITGPPTHSVGRGPVLFCSLASVRICRRLLSSVTLHGGAAGGFTRAGQALTSCRLQSNYSCTVALHGGPVVLRPVRATLCS